MGTRPEGLLKELVSNFPYTPPSDVYPDKSQHTWLWNMALREGRQQVIRWIAEQAGVDIPPTIYEAEDVFSAQDRNATSSDSSACRRSGREYPEGR